MPTKTITVHQHTCTRCGYVWTSRQTKKPKNCASKKCKSKYWDTPRVRIVADR